MTRHPAPQSPVSGDGASARNNRSKRRRAVRRAALSAVTVSGLAAALLVSAVPGQAAPRPDGFVSVYGQAKPDAADEKAFLEENHLLENVADSLNKRIRMPATVEMTGRSCGNTDVAYDPETSQIDVCYEFVAEARDLFEKAGTEQVAEKTAGVMAETLYHESAHALIDKLRLPFTGREEDVADQFAAYNLIPEGPKGQRAVLAAAANYDLLAERPDPKGIDFSDEHAPDAARAANYRSYLYGANPQRWKSLVDGKHLTRDRSEFSEIEYEGLQQGWSGLLASHLR
ncbi:DUF4344 domain-containing metallopeptidase [Streptomyces sp. NPDC048483]|uniref:DUF4344 domain-containing metallopeptidase n=1 Tax=Streptomyces sp. NPDC048483 TaxID=3154927 RepID=UPI0034448C8E